MELTRGWLGRYPSAAIGDGEPLLLLDGLGPVSGEQGEQLLRGTLGPFAALAERRRLIVMSRRRELPRGMTMAELAAEHAEAIAAALPAPVDVIGLSTGGSVAQQLAADHPEVVRRLVLASTACRLGPVGKREQRRVAARVRAGAVRRACAVLAAALVPPWRGRLAAAALAWTIGPLMLKDRQGLDDMATTIEAEDAFDLADLAPIQAPTLIVAGRDDRFYTPELFQRTADLIADSTLLLLEGRGHITALNDKRTRAALRDFLN
jgi:pimeloyl-ACP methyl ester carboxylesterase